MNEAGRPVVDTDRQQVLITMLKRPWHRPVLQAIADGPTRYVDIRRRIAAEHGTAPGEGQVNTTLRELAELGLARKEHLAVRPPWVVTDHGRTALRDLEALERLMRGTQDPPQPDTEVSDTDTAAAASSSTPAGLEDLEKRLTVLNTSVAHPARRYNYWLGGKDNFEADRRSAEAFEAIEPATRAGVRENRDVLRRVVHHLAAEAGIRQFLDIGTGLPTADNTHEVAQAVAPSSRVVYADNDPLVLAHARALLTSDPQGRTSYIEADLREPEKILNSSAVRDTFDLNEPVALLLIAVLHFIPGKGAAKPIVARLLDGLPRGSYLAVTHITLDFAPPEHIAYHEQMRRDGRSDFWPRPKDEIAELFDGLELLSPGLVPNTHWRPRPETPDLPLRAVGSWAGVGRKH